MSSDWKSYVNESLEFLDNQNVKYGLYTFLVLYIIFVIPQLTPDVSHIFNNSMLQLFFLFLIIYISFKDIYLGILLLIALLMSLHADVKNMILFSIPKPSNKPATDTPNKILIEPSQQQLNRGGASSIEITDVPSQQVIMNEAPEPMGYNDSGYRDVANVSIYNMALESQYN